MRRRAAEFRRPVRRRFSRWICLLLGAFSLAGLVLFFVLHHHHEDRVQRPVMVRTIPFSCLILSLDVLVRLTKSMFLFGDAQLGLERSDVMLLWFCSLL
ncbi:putative galacturonosyltransferase 11 [Sesbania bispinosa]|nr:putative galacturonosyltransferase 11 [Sesbania bispinosa]